MKTYFEGCDLPVCSVLLDVHGHVANGDWHSAKKTWLDFSGHNVASGSLNLLGDESEMSISHLGPLMASTVTGTCRGGTCANPFKTYNSLAPLLV